MSSETNKPNNQPAEVREVNKSKLVESVEDIMAQEDVSVVVIYKDGQASQKMSGNEFFQSVEEIVEEKNVSRIVITKSNGETWLDISLRAGVAMTVLSLLLAPKVLGLGVVATLLARFKVEVVSQKVKTVQVKAKQGE